MDHPVSVVMDANACIRYAALVYVKGRPLCKFECLPVRGLVSYCLSSSTPIGRFKKEEDHAYKNVVHELKDITRGLSISYYEQLRFKQITEKKLNGLFSTISLFVADCPPDDVMDAKAFYKANEKDMSRIAHRNPTKSAIPEDHDLELLVRCNKLSYERVSLLTEDTHFTGYSAEISKQYKVEIFPLMDVSQFLYSCRWPVPTA